MSSGRLWLPEDILTYGRRVILNPESKKYENFKRQIGATEGYIRDMEALDSIAISIASEGALYMPEWNVQVDFDNGIKVRIEMRHLLPVEAPFRDVMKIITESNTYNCFKDGEDREETEGSLIRNGAEITGVEIKGKEFFDKVVKDAYKLIFDGESNYWTPNLERKS